MAFHELLNATCRIQTKTVTQNDLGETVEGVPVESKDTPTRRSPMTNADPQTIGNYPVTTEHYKFYFTPETEIELTQTIKLSTGEGEDDYEEYEVQYVGLDSSKSIKKVYAKITKYA